MKIKKPVNGGTGAAPGGAAIADRFRLDAGPAKPKAAADNSVASIVAFSVAFVALLGLAFLLWKICSHADTLNPAM